MDAAQLEPHLPPDSGPETKSKRCWRDTVRSALKLLYKNHWLQCLKHDLHRQQSAQSPESLVDTTVSRTPDNWRKKGQAWDARFHRGKIVKYDERKRQWAIEWFNDAAHRGGVLTEWIGPQELKRRVPDARLAKPGRELSDRSIELYLDHAEPGPAWYLRQNQSAKAQQWQAACRTSSDLGVTRDKRRPDAEGKCECGADREDARHLYLECELYAEQRSNFLTELHKFQQAILAERKKAFGPDEVLKPGEKEGLWMWIHTARSTPPLCTLFSTTARR